jgi:glycine cleavage system H protein
MSVPNDRRYLQTHEWHKLDGDVVTIGITQIAADELTDVTYVSLPKVGDKVTTNQRFGEIESVKATSELYCGIDGAIVAVNDEINNDPSIVNKDPYGAGWLVKVKPSDAGQVGTLLSAEAYQKQAGH